MKAMKLFAYFLILSESYFLSTTVNSKFIIQSPQGLIDKFPKKEGHKADGIIEVSYANFGLIPYGHSMHGRIVFDSQYEKACDDFPHNYFYKDEMMNREKADHMKEGNIADDNDFDNKIKTGDITTHHLDFTPFYLADRGECTFVEKVRKIEEAGAGLAIIVDNKKEDVSKIVMSDDGSGAGLRIPSMLISYEDGQELINFMKTSTKKERDQISIVVEFQMQRPDNRVEYDIWYSSNNDLVLDFIQDFQDIDKKLGNQVLMTPHFVYWECKNCGNEFISANCFSAGQYCATDHGNKLTGQEIILENLRQKCIHKQVYSQDKRFLFFRYVTQVHDECGSYINEECSQRAHEVLHGLNWEETAKCVAESFGTIDYKRDKAKWNEKDTKNKIIDQEIQYWNAHGGNIIPSIVINNATYRGQMESQAVMNAICAGFKDVPQICKPILEDPDLQDDYEVGVYNISDHGYGIGHILLICFIAILVLLMVLYCYRRHAKRQMKETMNKQIETAVNHYVALSQGDTERKSQTGKSSTEMDSIDQ